jgi:hypothetical protein
MFGMPTGRGGGGGLESSNRQRMATEQWEVAKGGPGIIGEPLPWRIAEPEDPAEDILDQFEKWIKVKGYPWALDQGEGDAR